MNPDEEISVYSIAKNYVFKRLIFIAVGSAGHYFHRQSGSRCGVDHSKTQLKYGGQLLTFTRLTANQSTSTPENLIIMIIIGSKIEIYYLTVVKT
jgi:hypothetical protein